ncbi:MAG: glycosyltransferase [Candidatus Rokubacteria bacterium]|nr:glycosyltransferase [Candidatus Rokubacteria bacterium]
MAGPGPSFDDYRAVAPRGTVDFLLRIGERLRGRRFVHVTGSRYGGPGIEVLNRMVPLLLELGIDAGWEILVGDAEFDTAARAVGVALGGTEQVVTETMLAHLQATCAENGARLPLDGDLVLAHDAPPLLLVDGRPDGGRWVWIAHGDLSAPQPQVWGFVRRFITRYDAAVFSLPRFGAPLPIPRFMIYPSIDPLSPRNREMPRAELAERLARLGVPRDKPFLLQVGPWSRAHDPLGVINAYRLVKKHYDVRLVLAAIPGPVAAGASIVDEVREAASRDPDILPIAMPPSPEADLNALERGANIVIQKPLTTDFGLEAATAMWKGKPVIASYAGGLPHQIVFNVTGYTVDTVEGAAFRIRHLLANPELIGRMGAAGREHVRRHFLMTRHLGDYLALLTHLTKQG